MPATRNTQVRAPLASTHARSEPAPESFKFVTSKTAPPRPPTEAAPPPCAPGKAGRPPDCCGAATLTVAEPVLLESALLVAVTVSAPAWAGAVYSPDEVMLPKAAFHRADLSEALPCTVAVNCNVSPVVEEVGFGETATDVTVEPGGVVVTVTMTEADLVASATLVAVTVAVPAVAGAV